MGREERRREERQKKKELSKQNNMSRSRSKSNAIVESLIHDVTEHNTRIFLTCLGLTLHDEYGFGKKRIMRTLEHIDHLTNDILTEKATIEELEERLHKETGVSITFDSKKGD